MHEIDPRGESPSATLSPRVLVVDDERSCTEIVARLLTDRGYVVDVASEGTSALDLVAKHSYALLVLDYQMPGMNGVDVFRRAMELRPGLIGILLTAYPRINVVFPAINSRVERVLTKPLDAEEFLPLVEQLIGPGWRPKRPTEALLPF